MKKIKLLAILFIINVCFIHTVSAAAPSATNLSATETYTEDTPLNLIDIVASDADGGSLIATLTLSNPAAGSLTTATSGAVTSTYDSGTGVWTASGAIADINTLLAGVTFIPALNFNSSFFINTRVEDGSASANGSKNFIGIAVNDPPTATNLSTAETYTEDVSLNLVDIVVSDVDSSTVTATLTLSNTSAGTLSTATSGAVTSTFSSGVWTASGAIANVNALLAGVTFVPASNFNGSFTIATSVSDGVAPSLSGTKTFTGVPINDAPVLDSSKSPSMGTVNENAGAPVGAVGVLVSSLVDFAVPAGQVDNITEYDSGSFMGIAINAVNSNFSCSYSLNGGTTWTTLGAVSASSSRLLSANGTNRLYCRPNVGIIGSFSNVVTFRAWDQTSGIDGGLGDASSTGGTTAFSSTTDTVTITVNSTGNHDPVVDNDEYTIDQDSAITLLYVLANDSDIDGDTLSVTTLDPIGTLSGNFVIAAPPTAIGYASSPGFCGDDQVTYFVSDGNGGTASGVVTVHVVNCDTVTETPTLISPATNGTYYTNTPLTISFTLPELLSANSLVLTFVPTTGSPIVINLRDAPPGTNSFSLDPTGGISGLPEVVSTTSNTIPAGTYTVSLTYQDYNRNAIASTQSINVRVTNPPVVSSETVASGSVVLLGCTDPLASNYNPSSANNSLGCTYQTKNQGRAAFHFKRNLSQGMSEEDVLKLQQFLNSHGYIITITGPGSPGKETNFFGKKTKIALMQYQKDKKIDPIGVLGPKTRTSIEQEINK